MRVTQVTIPGRGTLQGTTISDSNSGDVKCHRFSRVPYALPPTGTRRWRKPEPIPSSFSYSLKTHATKYITHSSPCPQLSLPGLDPRVTDEDCLSLEIWVPLGTPPDGGWPVFFYIRKPYAVAYIK
jgi:carboxylesterase type B